MEPAFICSDGNVIYEQACEMLNIPLYVRPSNYTKVLKNAGYIPIPRGRSLSQEELAKRWQQNRDIVERLYRDGAIDYISHRGLAAAILRLPDVNAVLMDLMTRGRHYQIAKDDLDCLESLKYRRQKN